MSMDRREGGSKIQLQIFVALQICRSASLQRFVVEFQTPPHSLLERESVIHLQIFVALQIFRSSNLHIGLDRREGGLKFDYESL